jgi:hypothetical protein
MLTKIGRTAWQNWSDSKNRTDFGCSCKRGVRNQVKCRFLLLLLLCLMQMGMLGENNTSWLDLIPPTPP